MTLSEYQNKILLRQIRATRYSSGEVKKLLDLLDNADKQLKQEIRKTAGIATKKRYQEVQKVVRQLSKDLKDNADGVLNTEELIESEINFQRKLLANAGLVDITLPSASEIMSAVKFKPYATTANYDTFLDSIESGFYNTWDNALRTGYLTGQPTDKIVRNVLGSLSSQAKVAQVGGIHKLRESLERNTRTYLMSMMNETRERMYKANEDLFFGFQWLATLDRATCLLCGSLDNKVFTNLKDFESPPLHYNCRCVVIPLIKDFEEFVEDETRASMGGEVSAKLDYNSWLQGLDSDTQLEILGKTRYNMFKSSGQDIRQFVQDNRILSIKELNELY